MVDRGKGRLPHEGVMIYYKTSSSCSFREWDVKFMLRVIVCEAVKWQVN